MAAIEDKPDATVGRMLERLNKIENFLAGLGDTAELHKRIENLENSQYTNKDVSSLLMKPASISEFQTVCCTN